MTLLDRFLSVVNFGHQFHPWSNRFGVRLVDVEPGFMAIANPKEPSLDSPSGLMGWSIRFTFMSKPYKKNGKLHAKILIDGKTEEIEMSLWELGIIPDYNLRPTGDEFDPPGWYPWCNCFIDDRDKRWKQWVSSR